MSWPIILKLAGIFAVIGIGWGTGRVGLLGADGARMLSNAAFYLFTPPLLARTTARIELDELSAVTLLVYFGPVIGLMLVVYGWNRARHRLPPAGPAVRGISTTFGNSVQLGIPLVAALFGEVGLSVHITLVSMHGLTLLTLLTVLVEVDRARAEAEAGRRSGAGRVALTTVRQSVIHPVTLPVLIGLGWNITGLPIPGPVDDLLLLLGQGVVPVALIAIGMSLQQFGMVGVARTAVVLSIGKLLVQPTLVFVAAHWLAGLSGVPLAVLVLCAALPTGSNALLFAQRYDTLPAEATATIVVSTVAFVLTAPLWLFLTGLSA